MISPETIKKIATVLRSQETEKQELKDKNESLEKEASINRTVLTMLKEGLIDSEDIDTKIAEFQSNPQLLSETVGFFEKKAIGSLKDNNLPEGEDAENMFWVNLQGGN